MRLKIRKQLIHSNPKSRKQGSKVTKLWNKKERKENKFSFN